MARSKRKRPPLPAQAGLWPWGEKGTGAFLASLAAIVAAGWAAHGGCLHAVFFLDDWGHIVNNPSLRQGAPGSDFNSVTEWTYRLFGSGAFACHLGNLLIHLLFAVLVWRLGPLFFRHAPRPWGKIDPGTAAFFAALLFATHPLASEITHYARARDHELVGLFSFLTATATLLWLKRGWRWAPAVLAAGTLAAMAKGPGPAHAVLAFAATCLFLGTRDELRARFLHRWTAYALAVLPLLALVAAPGSVLLWVQRISGTWGGGLFGLHALTQARVFWEYAWRMPLPLGLCPDHLIAYTKTAADLPAWLGLAGIAAGGAVVAVLWRNGHRLAAFLLFMVAANLLLRWFYVLSELMVEYRVYPSMPWLCLLAGAGLAWLFLRRRATALALLAVLLGAGIVLTRERSAVWSSSEALTGSILRQYPWQLRAYMELTYLDYLHHDPDAALARLPGFYARLREALEWNRESPDRAYANWPLWAVSVECNVADCLLRAGRLAEADEILRRTHRNLLENHLEDDLLWDSWRFEMAKLENRRGDYGRAWLDLRRMNGWLFDPADYAAELDRAGNGWAAQAPAPSGRGPGPASAPAPKR